MSASLGCYDDRAYPMPARSPWEPMASPPATEFAKMHAELLAARAELEALRAERAPPVESTPTPRPFPARALRHRVQAIGFISTIL